MELIDIYPDFGNSWKLLKIYRDDVGKKHYDKIETFQDYFYVTERIVSEITKYEELNKQIVDIEEVYDKKPLFYNGKMYKVTLAGIWSKFKFMKYFRDDLKDFYELDVSTEMRYVIDNVSEFKFTNYKVLFFDIETTTYNGFPDYEDATESITCITYSNSFDKKLISLILKPTNWDEKWWQMESEIQKKVGENSKVLFFGDEKKMINYFLDHISIEDYDILSGWNINFDISYIFGRCDKLNLSKCKMSPFGKVSIRTVQNKQHRDEMKIDISGRFVIDLLQRYKAITFKEIPSYSLEYVSELEFGVAEKKRKVLDFTEEWLHHLEDLILYSIKDVDLLIKLNEKLLLINYLEELRRINYLPNISYAEVAKNLIDISLFREYGDKIIFPSKQNVPRVKLGGGFVKEPEPNIYEYVAVYDFAGLYPSLIRTFNLSKETICELSVADFVTNEDDVEMLPNEINRKGFVTGWKLEPIGMIPHILEKALLLRKQIKKEMKGLDKNSIEYREKNLKQYALKAPINANYGVNAYPGFRLYEPRVAATITYLGRRLNKYCSKRIEEEYDVKVVYGDTDSFFVEIGKDNQELANKIFESINKKYVQEFVSEISSGKVTKNYIEVEYEKMYVKVLLIKKRRYLGIKNNDEWDYKGVDLKRSNTPEVLKNILSFYIDELFAKKDEDNILRECRIRLYNVKELDPFKIPLKLTKEYASDLPQVRASSWANKHLKSNLKQGNKFYGIWVTGMETDIIGFKDIEELDGKNINIDYYKYESMLKDKINNLKEGTILKDFSQMSLENFL